MNSYKEALKLFSFQKKKTTNEISDWRLCKYILFPMNPTEKEARLLFWQTLPIDFSCFSSLKIPAGPRLLAGRKGKIT